MTVTSVKDTLVRDALHALIDGEAPDTSGYVSLDRSGRARVRSALDARILTSVRNRDEKAQEVLLAAIDAVKSVSSASSGKEQVDPKVRIAERVAILRFAAEALFGGMVPVSGVTSEMPILDESDIPDMTDEMVQKAMKLATFSIGTKTKENDIPALIRTVFANVPNGTFMKVSVIRAEIGRINSIPVTSAWDGRINASLFPKDKDGNTLPSRVEGVEAVQFGHPAYTDRNGAIRVESDSWDDEDTEDTTDETDNEA